MGVRQDALRDLEREARRRGRERLAQLKAAIAAARERRRSGVKDVARVCRETRAQLRTKARERIEQLRAELREAIEARRQLREESRGMCRADAAAARADATAALQAARAALERERADQRLIYGRGRRPSSPLSSKAEQRSESDDEVRNNLPPELVPVFNRVRDRIRASDRRTRTEAFLEWAHDHPETVYEISAAEDERHLDQLVRDEEKMRAAMVQRKPCEVLAMLEEAPF